MKALYDGTCASCQEPIFKGDEIITPRNGKAVHRESCTGVSDFQNMSSSSNKTYQEEGQTYRQSLKRKPSLCKECNLMHSGDCY